MKKNLAPKQKECGHEETTPTGKGDEWKCDLCGLVYTPERLPHTPGPWEIVSDDGSAAVAAEPTLIIQSADPKNDKDDRHIAFCFDEGFTNDVQARADARLIAAAPETTEQLRKLYTVALRYPNIFADALGSFWAVDVGRALDKAGFENNHCAAVVEGK